MRKAAWIFTPALVLGLAACGDDGGRGTETETTGTMTTGMSTGPGTGTGTTDDMMTSGTPTTTDPTTSGPTTEPDTSTSTTDMTTGTSAPMTSTTTGAELTCEEYCGIYATACVDFSAYDNAQECLDQCSRWPEGALNDTGGDSLGCRLYHVTVAGMGDANTHCPHAGPSGGGVCADPAAPLCATYCTTYLANCMADLNAYADEADCLTQCAEWYPGTATDTAGDTVGCREYHAGAAVADAMLHCPHAGPGGN
jgi:hypothetical protein